MVVLAVIAPFILLPLLMVMSRVEQRLIGSPAPAAEAPPAG